MPKGRSSLSSDGPYPSFDTDRNRLERMLTQNGLPSVALWFQSCHPHATKNRAISCNSPNKDLFFWLSTMVNLRRNYRPTIALKIKTNANRGLAICFWSLVRWNMIVSEDKRIFCKNWWWLFFIFLNAVWFGLHENQIWDKNTHLKKYNNVDYNYKKNRRINISNILHN